jgi:hypothetical protein
MSASLHLEHATPAEPDGPVTTQGLDLTSKAPPPQVEINRDQLRKTGERTMHEPANAAQGCSVPGPGLEKELEI